jgi:predicted nucleotidyltransferase
LTIGTVQQELKKLSKLGLVNRQKDGNRIYYEANRMHPLYIEIHRVVIKTVGLADVLRQALNDERIQWAFIFGSIARGEETEKSDIDLMIVGGIGLRVVTGLLSGVAQRLGREINPHVFRQEEFLERRESQDHFISQVLNEPKLFVVGDSNEFERLGR